MPSVLHWLACSRTLWNTHPAPACGAVGGDVFLGFNLHPVWSGDGAGLVTKGHHSTHTHTHRMFFFWTGLWTPDTSVLEPDLWHTVTDSKRWLAFTGWPFSWCMQTYLLEKMLQTIRSLYWRNSVDIMLRIVTFKSLAKWSSIVQFGSSRCYESEGFLKLFGRKPQHLLGGRCHLRAEHLHPVRRHTDHWGFVVRDRRHGAPLSAFWRV